MAIQVGNGPRRRTRLTEAAPNPKTLAARRLPREPAFIAALRSCLSQRSTSGMHATGPGSAKSRGARISSAWLAWIVTWSATPSSRVRSTADAAVARAVGQFIEQVRQVGSGRLGQAAEDAGIARHEIDPAFDLGSPLARQEAAVAGHDVVGQARAPRPAIQSPSRTGSRAACPGPPGRDRRKDSSSPWSCSCH